MMKHAATVFRVFVWALVSAPAIASAAPCTPQTFGVVTVRIESDKLVAQASGKTLARHQLPVVGSAWRCLSARAFPEKRLLFIEWHGGEAGTSQIFHKISLLAFSVDTKGVRPRGGWTLRQGYRGGGPSIVEADRTWRLEENEWAVDVILKGTRRIGIEPE